jgi:transcriptional regulator with XRE-family HTH domain
VSDRTDGETAGAILSAATTVHTLPDLAQLLRQLRRRHARHRGDSELTYRELAAKTGWSQAAVWEYLAGRTLPSTDRFDDLVRLFGATPAEQGALATARDRVEELRRREQPAAHPPDQVVPRQLPPAVRHFVGRLSELDTLTELADHVVTGGGAVTISSIDGTAGIGKTALAVYWAHRVRERFPDGQLYVNLRGFDPNGPPVGPADAVRAFLEAFGVAPHRIPAGPDAQAALYRSLVADRRVLVVLDNARDVEQVLPLLPASPGSLAVVTSRNRLTGLVATLGAHPLTIDLPSASEARELLARRLGTARVAAEPRAVDDIVDRCARLPLALALVAAARPRTPGFRSPHSPRSCRGRWRATCERCSRAPTRRSTLRRPGYSGSSVCIPARTLAYRRRPAWSASR